MIVIQVLQVIVSVLLIGAILLQARGSGVSATFGGNGEFYRSRRSLERVLLIATIVFGVLFAAFSIALFIL